MLCNAGKASGPKHGARELMYETWLQCIQKLGDFPGCLGLILGQTKVASGAVSSTFPLEQ